MSDILNSLPFPDPRRRPFSSILDQATAKPGATSSPDHPQEGIAGEYRSSLIAEQVESIPTPVRTSSRRAFCDSLRSGSVRLQATYPAIASSYAQYKTERPKR